MSDGYQNACIIIGMYVFVIVLALLAKWYFDD